MKAKYQKNLVFLFLIAGIFFVYKKDIYNSKSDTKAVPKIWVTLSVCWSDNVEGNYPYTYGAQLSSRLWGIVTDGEVSVLLTIVYNTDANMEALENYAKPLQEEGVVIVLEETTEIGCILQSQLTRMFSFKNQYINDEDIIIASDVDLFPMDKRIIEPLKKNFSTWIYRYGKTTRLGNNFSIMIFAMRSKDWRKVLDYSHVGVDNFNVIDIVKYFNKTFNFNSEDKAWGIDQVLLTYSVLSHGYCTLPQNHAQWAKLKLTPPASTVDAEQIPCYKGETEGCCTRSPEIPGGCIYWHFQSWKKKRDMKEKFDEIISKTAKDLVK